MPWESNGGSGGPWGSSGGPSGGGNKKGGGGGQNPWGSGSGSGFDLDDLFKKGQKKFEQMTGGGLGSPRGVGLILILVFMVYLFSGLYRVLPDEQGVVLRFGEWVKTTEQGLNYHLPYPIESIEKVKVTQERRIEIGKGLSQDPRRFAQNRQRSGTAADNNDNERLMLTGDENIVDANFIVDWNIKDAGKYLFNIRNPEATVRIAAESAMREIVGQTPIQEILTERKEEIEFKVKERLQSIMNSYEAGISIIRVQLGQVIPPPQVIDAFDDVQRSRADQERKRNEADAYRNDIIPKARGNAVKLIEQANAYREEVINRAKGDAARFNSILAEYRQAKSITKQRLYLETMEEILQNVNKVVVDGKISGTGVLPYLPLNELKKPSGGGESANRFGRGGQ